MHPRVFLFAIVTAVLFGSLVATPASARLRPVAPGTHGEIVVPAAWSGIWSYVDSTFDCTGELLGTDSGLDTLCTGMSADPGEGEPFPVECSGTVTDNTIDMTCNYSDEPIPDCTITFTLDLDGTMTGDSYVITTVTTFTYEGTAKGCDKIPDQCQRLVSRATRIGPEPTEYCATPADVTSWGRVKSRYR